MNNLRLFWRGLALKKSSKFAWIYIRFKKDCSTTASKLSFLFWSGISLFLPLFPSTLRTFIECFLSSFYWFSACQPENSTVILTQYLWTPVKSTIHWPKSFSNASIFLFCTVLLTYHAAEKKKKNNIKLSIWRCKKLLDNNISKTMSFNF